MGPVTAGDERGERVYLGLGTNLGDREANLRHALDLLGKRVALTTTSSVYDTEPWGFQDQPRYLNCVCEAWTSLEPWALLAAVKDVERAMGRQPSFPNGPRLIDVDILLYGQRVVRGPGLEIPHPRLGERAFVLAPLGEIAPTYSHPVLKLTVGELLRRIIGARESVGGMPQGVKLWAPAIPVAGLTDPRTIIQFTPSPTLPHQGGEEFLPP